MIAPLPSSSTGTPAYDQSTQCTTQPVARQHAPNKGLYQNPASSILHQAPNADYRNTRGPSFKTLVTSSIRSKQKLIKIMSPTMTQWFWWRRLERVTRVRFLSRTIFSTLFLDNYMVLELQCLQLAPCGCRIVQTLLYSGS